MDQIKKKVPFVQLEKVDDNQKIMEKAAPTLGLRRKYTYFIVGWERSCHESRPPLHASNQGSV